MTTSALGVPALPGEPGYADATAVFNLAAPARPAMAITARTVDQVTAAVRHAVAAGLPVRVQTTGHAAAAVAPMDGCLLIRTALEGAVEVDIDRQVARIPAGARWGEVVAACARHGLAAPHGSAGTVGAVGYLLRGGMSFYGRQVGVAANSVRAVEVVTATGELVRADARQAPDLFWAMRGGGGGFGVVTAIEVALFDVAAVVTGAAYWPAEHAAELLTAWSQWTVDAPWAAATSFRVLNLPPVPQTPQELAGRPVVSVDGAVLSRTDDVSAAQRHAADLLGPLRAVAAPVLDTWHTTSPSAVLSAHLDPADPLPIVGDHMLFGELDSAGVSALLDVIGPGSGSPLAVAGLRQLGGAFAAPDPAGGVLDHVAARYSYAGSGAAFDAAAGRALHGHCTVVRNAMARWDTGATMPSFVEDRARPQRHLDDAQVAAVDAVRRQVDPDGVFAGDIAPNATAS